MPEGCSLAEYSRGLWSEKQAGKLMVWHRMELLGGIGQMGTARLLAAPGLWGATM